MKLAILTLFALVAFAANSVLTRVALANGQIGPEAFFAIRLLSGALTLLVLVHFRGGLRALPSHGNAISAAALLIYATAFSWAYISLDTGVGALILFGGVQLTMFAGSILTSERPPARSWVGAILGMLGLTILFAPGADVPDLFGALLMILAAIAWGIYSLRGRSATSPLFATAANFIYAAPVGILMWLVIPNAIDTTTAGVVLAIASGGLASGVGYAVWYGVLPKISGPTAAILQLTVPIIALTGGVVFLGEAVGIRFVIATICIIGGVVVAVYQRPRLPAGKPH